jgi:hypothetical protein
MLTIQLELKLASNLKFNLKTGLREGEGRRSDLFCSRVKDNNYYTQVRFPISLYCPYPDVIFTIQLSFLKYQKN